MLLLYSTEPRADRARIREVRRWGYQLQGAPPHPTPALDCIVVDADGAEGAGPVAEQVKRLKKRAGKPDRVVLAYLSIGEAENYRWYWQAEWKDKPPPFLAPENPHWRGNFKVRYWDPAWQAIVVEYLDRVIAAGFDGAYLDIIDAYEYFGPDGERAERKSAALDMSRLVARLAQHARVERAAADFLIVPQNGAPILRALGAAAPEYLDAVDAIGAEDTFLSGERNENNAWNVQSEVVSALERFRDAGKPVLTVEYVTDAAKIRKYLAAARARGFVPSVARRGLDRLVELKE